MKSVRTHCCSLVCLIFFVAATLSSATEIVFTDDAGTQHHLATPPKHIVSLVPSATEIIFALHGEDALAGITLHSSGLQGAADIAVVGGFLSPSMEKVEELAPDLIIATSLHGRIPQIKDSRVPVVVLKTRRMNDAFRHFAILGKLLNREDEAAALAAKNRKELQLIADKIAKIPKDRRKRVMRMMATERLMTPGTDSFQNEIIAAAGGIAPDFGRDGMITEVSSEEFSEFNPQLLYYCGTKRQSIVDLLKREGVDTVAAMQNQALYSFPCELTCRASSHVGYFVTWLASLIYSDEFSQSENEVRPRGITHEKPLSVDLDFVKKACVTTSVVHDFDNKSLIVDFTSPRTIVSTLDGKRTGIETVGNHYSPPGCWSLNHASSLKELQQEIIPALGKETATSSFLFTGANMDNLAVKKEKFKDMEVVALVTAGVRGNALRMSRDTGGYYEPGTINIIILSNMKLTERAMTRAIISATEGKSAALQDLDIRSSYQPLEAAATGTGTDNIIVVQGDGVVVDGSGGHTKMGELIARTAYEGVIEAIAKQNGIVQNRNIFERLRDRQLSVRQLVSSSSLIAKEDVNRISTAFEQLLLDSTYSGFLKNALFLSDGWQRKTITDISLFHILCLQVATNIAESSQQTLQDHSGSISLPKPFAMAVNAIITGLVEKQKGETR